MLNLMFGSIFFIVGIVSSIAFSFTAFESNIYELLIVAFIFCISFCTIGFIFMRKGMIHMKDMNLVKKYGREYYAKIVSYHDGNIRINHIPVLIITLIYYDNNGIMRTIDIDTQQTSEYKYPLMENLVIKVYNDIGVIVKNSVGTIIPLEVSNAFDDYIEKKKLESDELNKLKQINWN